MNKLLKDKVIQYGFFVIILAALFFMWRRQEATTEQMREKTAQMLEQTKQVSEIMSSPIEKETKYPERIEEGRRVEIEKITEKIDGVEERITERIIKTDPRIIDSGGYFRLTDYKPLPYEAEETEYFLWGVAGLSGNFLCGAGRNISGLSVGLGIGSNIKSGGFDVGVVVVMGI